MLIIYRKFLMQCILIAKIIMSRKDRRKFAMFIRKEQLNLTGVVRFASKYTCGLQKIASNWTAAQLNYLATVFRRKFFGKMKELSCGLKNKLKRKAGERRKKDFSQTTFLLTVVSHFNHLHITSACFASLNFILYNFLSIPNNSSINFGKQRNILLAMRSF